ncbi:mannitol dehydrogenase family protein [Algirhabdus cladophorae]|uniref:mannitol dehydrogenase family protein n=1 Tax=Algirhabdus cladophorae TaxID=3377108 RepID=UPI003B846343
MPKILHFGLGNFHRAHQAVYTQLCNEQTPQDPWRIIGVSLRSAKMRDQLAPQDFDYTLVIRDGITTQLQTVSVHDDCLVAPHDTPRIIDQIADPEVAIITLTITEKGYHLAPEGGLDTGDAAIIEDQQGAAKTIYGLLSKGLTKRDNAAPLTILSCDNLSDNGGTLARAFAQFAPHLARRIGTHLRFASSMVDRITPATTDKLAQFVADQGGLAAAPVETERFTQWAIEDNFAGPRPDWAAVGAQIVPDVVPFEIRKLRMLNGAHSYLAYAGILAGHRYVHQAIEDQTLRQGAQDLMREAAETLPPDTRGDAHIYAAELIARFENPHLHHELRQIAMDGSKKLPPRLFSTWTARKMQGLGSPAVEAACKAWVDFVRGELEAGRALDDPLFFAAHQTFRNSSADLDHVLLTKIAAPKTLIRRLLA